MIRIRKPGTIGTHCWIQVMQLLFCCMLRVRRSVFFYNTYQHHIAMEY